MKSSRKQRERSGRRAERLAELYLRLKGYSILQRRYKTRCGEIDIIAERKSVLAIIEVKHRKSINAAQNSLTPKAKQRIIKAATIYVSRTSRVQGYALRFDAIFVIKFWQIRHYPDLWRDY